MFMAWAPFVLGPLIRHPGQGVKPGGLGQFAKKIAMAVLFQTNQTLAYVLLRVGPLIQILLYAFELFAADLALCIALFGYAQGGLVVLAARLGPPQESDR